MNAPDRPTKDPPAFALACGIGAITEMLELIQRGARSEVPILLLGESGTGKELAARAIHDASPRSKGAFVPVECSGLGEALFESELFGHARGSFTGAHTRKPGLVEAATGGTLFLDEIGDVPLSLQVKLLRVLESGMYRPVGDIEARSANFRLVCATHRDLDRMVSDGSFRRDLYFRINTFPIAMPPLRERREDIPLLCDTLLANSAKRLSDEALMLLQRHDYPGNIRELRNIVERAVLLTDGVVIEIGANRDVGRAEQRFQRQVFAFSHRAIRRVKAPGLPHHPHRRSLGPLPPRGSEHQVVLQRCHGVSGSRS